MTDKETGELIDAAEQHAEAYNDDPRDCIKTDVINAFYAGVAWQQARAKQPEARPGLTLETCGVCGSGQLYCNECGTGFSVLSVQVKP